MNHFKMPSNVINYNLGGMGCSGALLRRQCVHTCVLLLPCCMLVLYAMVGTFSGQRLAGVQQELFQGMCAADLCLCARTYPVFAYAAMLMHAMCGTNKFLTAEQQSLLPGIHICAAAFTLVALGFCRP
jgi:hypothetical protein